MLYLATPKNVVCDHPKRGYYVIVGPNGEYHCAQACDPATERILTSGWGHGGLASQAHPMWGHTVDFFKQGHVEALKLVGFPPLPEKTVG